MTSLPTTAYLLFGIPSQDNKLKLPKRVESDRLAIRNGKVKENPAWQVRHRLENNMRIRFLSAEEETKLGAAIEAARPERNAELELALNTGLRMSEEYRHDSPK